MSGLSTIINSTAGAINGYRDQGYQQNAQDYAQAVRANDELKMQAAQSTYQPQAQAQIAQAGLSTAQANGQASLVPGVTQIAATNQQTAQSAADAALARQPSLNQTADNQAANALGFSSAQHEMLPTTLADFKAKGYLDDQTLHVAALNGLYNSMMSGPDSAKQYVQNMAAAGVYPNLSGKQIGQVGLSPDGQNFVAQDTDGNALFQLPVSSIQQAHSMSIPTEWHEVKPGATLAGTQGGRVTTTAQAPVPEQFSTQHDSALVKNAKWISANVTGGDNKKALALAQQANSMSKAQFISASLPNMMALGNMQANDAVNKLSQTYDMIRSQGDGTPGLSNAPASNTSGSQIIDSLIGNPANTAANPFAPNPE